MALTAPVWMADIKADKAKAIIIGDGGNAGDHDAIDKGAEKSMWIGGMKGDGIVEAGIPPFGRGPVEQSADLGKAEIADGEAHAGANPARAPE